jgi:hypothetical protein
MGDMFQRREEVSVSNCETKRRRPEKADNKRGGAFDRTNFWGNPTYY